MHFADALKPQELEAKMHILIPQTPPPAPKSNMADTVLQTLVFCIVMLVLRGVIIYI